MYTEHRHSACLLLDTHLYKTNFRTHSLLKIYNMTERRYATFDCHPQSQNMFVMLEIKLM